MSVQSSFYTVFCLYSRQSVNFFTCTVIRLCSLPFLQSEICTDGCLYDYLPVHTVQLLICTVIRFTVISLSVVNLYGRHCVRSSVCTVVIVYGRQSVSSSVCIVVSLHRRQSVLSSVCTLLSLYTPQSVQWSVCSVVRLHSKGRRLLTFSFISISFTQISWRKLS